MRLHAFVLMNIGTDMFWGYRADSSALYHAHTFVIDADNPDRAVELIWILTNVDSADMLRQEYPHLAQYADDVIEYRRRENRSLSVGDVVTFYQGEKFLVSKACERLGWSDHNVDLGVGLEVDNTRPTSQARRAMQEFMESQGSR